MKNYLLFCLLLYGGVQLSGQAHLSYQVIANGGTTMEVPNEGTISWTIGELFFETYEGDLIFNQGFHQAYNILVTNIFDFTNSNIDLQLYPNPALDRFFVEIGDPTLAFSAQLFDLYGRPLQQLKIHGKTEVNIQNYPSGIYLLRLVLADGRFQTYKIQKQ